VRDGISLAMKSTSSKPRSPFKRPAKFDGTEANSFGLIDGDFDDPEEYEKDVVKRLRERGAL
jgi:hypothetical protein